MKVMDKAEELKNRINAILHNIVNNRVNLTYKLKDATMADIEQYAQQVSKENAIKFAEYIERLEPEYSDIKNEYDWWLNESIRLSNQEESNGY